MRHAQTALLLLCVCLAPMAEEMIILENGTVADADDLNHNFSLLEKDKDGPTLEVGDLVAGSTGNGLSGNLSVTASDPSGVWRIGQIYSGDFVSETLGVDGSTSLSQEFSVTPFINTSTDHYFFAEDFKGNKTIEKRTFVGPTTQIKPGRYTMDAQDFAPDACHPDYTVLLRGVDLSIRVVRWPDLQYELLWVIERPGEGTFLEHASYGNFGSDDYSASGASVGDESRRVTTIISVNSDSTFLSATYTQECWDLDIFMGTVGPETFTFTLSERY